MSEEEIAAKPPKPAFVDSELLWDTLYSAEIRSGGQFENLTTHVISNPNEWERWAQSDNPYAEPTPGTFEEVGEGKKPIQNFDKLCLVRCLRAEKVTGSIAQYIIKDLEEFYVEPPSTQMAVLYEDIANFIPMIFVLSKGADPTSSLFKFAADRGIEADKILAISLGQGQGEKASKCIT